MAELSSVDYAFLAILKAEGREISNTEMDALYRVRLVSRPFERLVAAGYVASDTKRRPYRHAITSAGVKVLAAELQLDDDHVDKGEKRSVREQQLWAGLVALQRMLTGPKDPFVAPPVTGPDEPPPPADLDGRIRAAYRKLVSAPGGWVSLSALRPALADVPRAELDGALKQLLRAGDVRLEPDPLEHRLSTQERDAAVHVGGEYRHKLAIGRP
jgi:hypothetical protein